MRKKRAWKKLVLTAAMALAMTLEPVVSVTAADALWEQGHDLSLTLDLQKTSAVSSFSVYLVEEWTENGYRKTAAFDGYGTDVLDDASASGIVKKAGELLQYVNDHAVSPDYQGTTTRGILSFQHMKAGIYLIAQRADAVNTITVTETPYLLMLPMRSEGENADTYDVVSLPKYTEKTTPGGGGDSRDTEPDYETETESAPVTEPQSTEPTVPESSLPLETTLPYRTLDDGTPDVAPDHCYESRDDLPPTVIFEEMVPLGDGYFYNPDDGEVYYIFDEAVPLAKMGDHSVPTVVLSVICLLSGAGCVVLYRRRKTLEEEEDS
jgi:hypothetical protein